MPRKHTTLLLILPVNNISIYWFTNGSLFGLQIVESIISHGCFLGECSIQRSIIGERSRLDYGVELQVCVKRKEKIGHIVAGVQKLKVWCFLAAGYFNVGSG